MKTVIITAILVGMIALAGCINEPAKDAPIGGKQTNTGVLVPRVTSGVRHSRSA